MTLKVSPTMEIFMECAAACENCVSLCINDGKPLSCCPLCMDCADICLLCFRLESHNSVNLKAAARLCADFCEACAVECEKHAGYHAHCKACAEACRKCAEACRSMLN